MRRLYRTGVLVGALLLAIGTVLVTGISEASASASASPSASASASASASTSTVFGNEYCLTYDCLNSWNGGPWVNVYTGGADGTPNNYFTVLCNTTTGNCTIEDTGGNAWAGHCIGDAYNDPNNASTSLDVCGSGWGTNFKYVTSGCGPIGVAFYNNHWKGYLGPPSGAVNGSHWYLNKPTKYCFLQAL